MLYLAIDLLNIREEIETLFSIHSQAETNKPLAAEGKKEFAASLEKISSGSKALGLRMTMKAAERLRVSIQSIQSEEIFALIEALKARFEDELELIMFIYIPPEKMAYYDEMAPFGIEVEIAFPSADYDIKEAANCFALGRNTATVMHSMRVLECGITALGRALKVKRKHNGWGVDLKAFQKKWDDMLAKKPTNLGWRRQFYPQLFLHFHYFADAWRNRAFHSLTAQYGEVEAQRVFEHVRDFMKHLATRLSEKPKK